MSVPKIAPTPHENVQRARPCPPASPARARAGVRHATVTNSGPSLRRPLACSRLGVAWRGVAGRVGHAAPPKVTLRRLWLRARLHVVSSALQPASLTAGVLRLRLELEAAAPERPERASLPNKTRARKLNEEAWRNESARVLLAPTQRAATHLQRRAHPANNTHRPQDCTEHYAMSCVEPTPPTWGAQGPADWLHSPDAVPNPFLHSRKYSSERCYDSGRVNPITSTCQRGH